MEPHRLALPPGYRIENYEIQSVLGKGGFGITYAAYDWTLKRHMAIKELLPDSIATRIEGSTVVAMSPSHAESWQWARERFVEEAQILASFRHPNIIAVHRLIEANGTVYLVMDHLEGESYEARLRRIGREADEAALMAVMGPLLDGLQEVHAAGLLHRDIKPENILFDKRGNPVLIDFGAARATVGATMTMTSIVTHGYSPIEQYQTKGKMGPWTDIYAMGAVMCRAISGEKPPVASDRIIEDEFSWLSSRQPPGFAPTCLKAVDWALRVRPEERPKSISEWETHLRGAGVPHAVGEAGETLGSRSRSGAGDPHAPRETLPQPKRKSQSVLIAVVVAIALVGSLLATGMFIQSKEAEKRAEAVKSAANQKLREAQEAAATAKAEVARAEAARAEAEKKAEEQARLAREEQKAETLRLETARAEAIRKDAEKAKNEFSNAFKGHVSGEAKENSIGMKLVWCPSGQFTMGSPTSEFHRSKSENQVQVELSNGFWIGKFEVTQQQYARVMGLNPSKFTYSEQLPVETIAFNDAKDFCCKLTKIDQDAGLLPATWEYRLPTEAEWEYACRAGTTTAFSNGKNLSSEWGKKDDMKGIGWYRGNSDLKPHEVGTKQANPWGLHDMHGNVSEICKDMYSITLKGGKDPVSFGGLPVIRGGGWQYGDFYCRSASRLDMVYKDTGASDIGFRIVAAQVKQ